jgi:hypothetical protein
MELKDTSGYSAGRALDEMIAVAQSAERTLARAERKLADTRALLAGAASLRERRKLRLTPCACPDVRYF